MLAVLQMRPPLLFLVSFDGIDGTNGLIMIYGVIVSKELKNNCLGKKNIVVFCFYVLPCAVVVTCIYLALLESLENSAYSPNASNQPAFPSESVKW